MSVEVGLQDDGSGYLIQVTAALLARDIHLDASRARFLRAEGFVPHLNGGISLSLQCFGKAGCPAAGQVRLPVLVEGLADDDQPGLVLGCDGRHLGSIDRS